MATFFIYFYMHQGTYVHIRYIVCFLTVCQVKQEQVDPAGQPTAFASPAEPPRKVARTDVFPAAAGSAGPFFPPGQQAPVYPEAQQHLQSAASHFGLNPFPPVAQTAALGEDLLRQQLYVRQQAEVTAMHPDQGQAQTAKQAELSQQGTGDAFEQHIQTQLHNLENNAQNREARHMEKQSERAKHIKEIEDAEQALRQRREQLMAAEQKSSRRFAEQVAHDKAQRLYLQAEQHQYLENMSQEESAAAAAMSPTGPTQQTQLRTQLGTAKHPAAPAPQVLGPDMGAAPASMLGFSMQQQQQQPLMTPPFFAGSIWQQPPSSAWSHQTLSVGQTGSSSHTPPPVATTQPLSQAAPAAPLSQAALAASLSQTAPAAPLSQAAPAAPLNQTAPAASLNQTAPAASLSQTAPAVSLSQTAPAASLSQTAPAAPLNQAAPAAPLNQTAPAVPLTQTAPVTQTGPLSQTAPVTQTGPLSQTVQTGLLSQTAPPPVTPETPLLSPTAPSASLNQTLPVPTGPLSQPPAVKVQAPAHVPDTTVTTPVKAQPPFVAQTPGVPTQFWQQYPVHWPQPVFGWPYMMQDPNLHQQAVQQHQPQVVPPPAKPQTTAPGRPPLLPLRPKGQQPLPPGPLPPGPVNFARLPQNPLPVGCVTPSQPTPAAAPQTPAAAEAQTPAAVEQQTPAAVQQQTPAAVQQQTPAAAEQQTPGAAVPRPETAAVPQTPVAAQAAVPQTPGQQTPPPTEPATPVAPKAATPAEATPSPQSEAAPLGTPDAGAAPEVQQQQQHGDQAVQHLGLRWGAIWV